MNLKNNKNRVITNRYSGQEMAEWGLIIALVSVVVIGSLVVWGERTIEITNTLIQTLQDANTNMSTST